MIFLKYPDYEFYRTVFCGSEDEEVIMPFIRAAGDILRGRIIMDELSEKEEEMLFRAICAQGEYIAESEGFSSVKLGDFSAQYPKAEAVCPRAMAILDGAGLFFRGNVTMKR